MGSCSSGRHRKVDLQVELSYAADGGGPMICAYYAGKPPPRSTGALLLGAMAELEGCCDARVDVFVWDVTEASAEDWRAGLGNFGIPEDCELPAVVIHAASRTYRQALKTLQGPGCTEPDHVLAVLKETWPPETPKTLWNVLSCILVPNQPDET